MREVLPPDTAASAPGDACRGGAPAADTGGSAAVQARLASWRAAGADRLAPTRFALLDALARRASAHAGATRRVLDARLDALLADYAATIEQAAARDAGTTAAAPARRAFAALDAHLARAARHAPPAELHAYFREVWSTLSADRQLRQSRQSVPKNAGPLNSSSLMHRALLLMRELSPDYLRQFLAYTDALAWLEDLNGAAASAAQETPRATGATKQVRRSRAR